MSNLPVSYLPGESIVRAEEKVIHVKNNVLGLGYNLIYGTLWLTTQRIVFQSFPLGNLLTYPLSHIRNAAHVEVNVAQKVLSTPIYNKYNSYNAALYLEFDDGGQEYFIPADLAGWAAAIMEAKTGAPALPFTQTPPSRSVVQEGNRGLWVMLGILGAIVLCFVCSVAACVGFPFLLALLDTGR
jgi:hypothetical protein